MRTPGWGRGVRRDARALDALAHGRLGDPADPAQRTLLQLDRSLTAVTGCALSAPAPVSVPAARAWRRRVLTGFTALALALSGTGVALAVSGTNGPLAPLHRAFHSLFGEAPPACPSAAESRLLAGIEAGLATGDRLRASAQLPRAAALAEGCPAARQQVHQLGREITQRPGVPAPNPAGPPNPSGPLPVSPPSSPVPSPEPPAGATGAEPPADSPVAAPSTPSTAPAPAVEPSTETSDGAADTTPGADQGTSGTASTPSPSPSDGEN